MAKGIKKVTVSVPVIHHDVVKAIAADLKGGRELGAALHEALARDAATSSLVPVASVKRSRCSRSRPFATIWRWMLGAWRSLWRLPSVA